MLFLANPIYKSWLVPCFEDETVAGGLGMGGGLRMAEM